MFEMSQVISTSTQNTRGHQKDNQDARWSYNKLE